MSNNSKTNNSNININSNINNNSSNNRSNNNSRIPPPPPARLSPPPPRLNIGSTSNIVTTNYSNLGVVNPPPPPPPAAFRITNNKAMPTSPNNSRTTNFNIHDTRRTVTNVNSPPRAGATGPPPPPHSVSPAMPVLESAPPSSNVSFNDLASYLSAATTSAASTELLQGAVDFFTQAATTTTTTTTTTGSSGSYGTGSYGSNNNTTTTTSTRGGGTVVTSLPPPPTLRNTAVSQPHPQHQQQLQQQQQLQESVFLSSPTVAPLPPPPPPPPPPLKPTTTPYTTSTTTSSSAAAPQTSTSSPQKPDRTLPYTQFRSPKEIPLLTVSQTSLPVLILATEHANELAWKNGLYLSDMFEGLVQKNLLMFGSTSSTPGSGQISNHIPPFRSASRTISTMTWDELATITFTEPEKLIQNTLPTQYASNEASAYQLQKAVLLQETDGNLQQELNVLEDQIDNLLYDNSLEEGLDQDDDETSFNSKDNNMHLGHGSNHDNVLSDMGKYERIQRRQEQAYRDAYQLTSPLNIPWLWRYRQSLDESTTTRGIIQHEMFSCPIVILTVCTTVEELNTIEALSMLQNQQFYLPPSYYKNGLFDPNNVRYEVLVLHDNVTGPKNWDESTLRMTLQRNFGSCAAVLRINSIPPETAVQLSLEETSDLWGGGGLLGNCLSMSDRANIRKYLTNFIQGAVIPALEKRIADLNAIVNDRKKGVKNVLKSLWGGGRTAASSSSNYRGTGKVDSTFDGGDDALGSSGPRTKNKTSNNMITGTPSILYRYDTIESQTRLLGDTLFLMKDYDAALSMYRLIKDDYKQDKAWVHYGSVLEMMAMCLYCMDPYKNSKEIFSNIESALLSYSRSGIEEMKQQQEAEAAATILAQQQQGGMNAAAAAAAAGVNQRIRCAPLSTRLATRLCLVLASTRNLCNGRHLEIADLLASASSGETSLGAAVLLEQSAAHYYKAEMFRKYAFHMLMSGHMYRSAMSADHHAFRCLTSALHIYRGSQDGNQWEELHNHLRSALASLLFSMGRMTVSLQLYAKLLGSTEGGRVSTKTQQKFVANLMEICNDHRKKALAGVDRMIASSKLSAKHRDKVRQEHLERIVQVIQYTKSASRVLELPNMDLPSVDDSTVVVIAEEQHHQPNYKMRSAAFGQTKSGSNEIWDDLMLWTTAELKASKILNETGSTSASDEVSPTIKKAISKIEDEDIRHVVTCIEKEKIYRALLERNKKRGTTRISAPVRAQMEPIDVQFTIRNPLGLSVDINDLQLVAKMTTTVVTTESNESSGKKHQYGICTNEDAVHIKPLASCNQKKKWTFLASDVEFEIADFCRISEGNTNRSIGGVGSSITTDSHKKESWKSAEDVKPYFVVTKSSYSLAPESKMTITASICPLAQGNLEIVGIRCRLLDMVWVYHPFDIKGPLLQNTRSNRANRVRGESFLLKSKVERGMPCLNVDLISRTVTTTSPELHHPVLQSQIGKWTLRVSNVGTAPASHITLKTTAPWINIDTTEHPELIPSDVNTYEGSATSYCIGPTGTLLRLPLDVFGKNQLTTDGQIQPGEMVDIPVEIRPSDNLVGKQDLYMLFRYELPLEGDTTSSLYNPHRFRWLKKMLEVPVYPSLSLSANIAPAFSSAHGEHILSLEFTNCRSDRPDKPEILLNSVNLASRHYKLEPISGQLVGTTGKFQLGWQERAVVHYKVVAKDENATPLLSECVLSTSPEGEEEKAVDRESTSSSLLNFLCLERAHDAFEEAISIYQMALSRATAQVHEKDNHPRSIADIRRANTPGELSTASSFCEDLAKQQQQQEQHADPATTPKKTHPTSVERLCPRENNTSQLLHILCTWSDKDQTIFGEHHIRGLLLTKPIATSNSSRPACPITVTATHPTTVSNDFKNGPAIVPLQVILRNRLAAGIASSTVEIEFAVDEPDNFDFVSCPLGGYRKTLKGGEELSIPLKAMLPTIGVYNLQRLRIITTNNISNPNSGEPSIAQHYKFPQHQWLVTATSI